MTRHIFTHLFIILCLVGGLTSCSTHKNMTKSQDSSIHDPWEGYNRTVFKINDALDQAILKPVAKGYRFVLPDFAERGVRNFMVNLRSPLDFGNQVLQGDGEGALEVLTRTVINTSFGVLGFIDIASDAGIPYEREDFGQTLAVWGVGSGPYLVMPIAGPGTVRDHFGGLVEGIFDPVRLYLFNVDEETTYFVISAVNVVSTRASLLDVLDDLKSSSIDYYAAVRSSYYQNRQAEIDDLDNEDVMEVPDIPDFEDDL